MAERICLAYLVRIATLLRASLVIKIRNGEFEVIRLEEGVGNF